MGYHPPRVRMGYHRVQLVLYVPRTGTDPARGTSEWHGVVGLSTG